MNTLDRIKAVNDAYMVDDKKEENLYRVKHNINQHFKDSIDYESEVEIDGEKHEAIVTDYKNSLLDKYLMVRPGDTFKLGALVIVYESYWLVTELNANRQVRTRGRLQQCNEELHWQNQHTLELHSKWCIMQKPYFKNLEDERLAEVSTREFKLLITQDSETAQFDVGRRFMMEIVDGEPKTYRITSVDTHTGMIMLDGVQQGFLIINLEQDQWNPSVDRQDLKIADYKSPDMPPPPPSDIHVHFQYTEPAEIKQGVARGKEFLAAVFDADGVPVFGAIPTLSVTMIPELEEHIEVIIEENRIKLIADSKSPLGGVIRITASYPTAQDSCLDVVVVSVF